LGLVLRVFVSAANVGERKGAKRVLKRVKRMGNRLTSPHRLGRWGYDGTPFLIWVMDVCRWIVRRTTGADQRLCLAQKRWVVERTFGWLMGSIG